MRRPHLDSDSIAEAVEDFVAESKVVPHQAHAVTTGVVNPANVAYTQADQTALAADFIALVTSYNLLLDHLIAAGVMASS
jgi:hypothetical protein